MLDFIRQPHHPLARRDEDGASAVEYGLLVAGIAALIVAIVFLFGGIISGVFNDTCDRSVDGNGAADLHRDLLIRASTPGGAAAAPPGPLVSHRRPAPLTREAPHVECARRASASRRRGRRIRRGVRPAARRRRRH